jgi:hypothetical protein
MSDVSDLELLQQLGVETKQKKKSKLTPQQIRVIAGFEEIQKFVEEHGHVPRHREDGDIFERLYAVRLNAIKSKEEYVELLKDIDTQDILQNETSLRESTHDKHSDEELLAELGIESPKSEDITVLKHVRPSSTRINVGEVATHKKCEDFNEFKPLFEAVQSDLDSGRRQTLQFRKDAGFSVADITQGTFAILRGQIIYVAVQGEPIKAPNGETDSRLRVIFSNGTENNMLQRSVIRAMYYDESSRLITEPDFGPLFSGESSEGDIESGTIYVLRSNSDNQEIKEKRQFLHKIGVTGGDVKKRIANAKKEPTYLMADVEIVATYKLFNINRSKLEHLIHNFFSEARLDIEIIDRFGNPFKPKEWFLVPLDEINKVVKLIQNNQLADYFYDINVASIKGINA